VGGGLTGLLAARVLADHFERVSIVDRDRFPDRPTFRAGVPQSRHIHTRLMRGRQILEQLFPGLGAELATRGIACQN
jgi:2-polyprenyl-6-methoxyphenol hydroxylase-like FAD-dependent oxidoreductase